MWWPYRGGVAAASTDPSHPPAPTAAPGLPDRVDVVIVGAGLSGIGAAWHLRHALGHLTFVILEGRDALGGTWDRFRYPGIRSDSDLHTYGYAFKPWTGDDAIASGPAILRYLEETVDEAELRPHLHFRRRVERISWSGDDACWTVEVVDAATGAAARVRCSWVVATTGYFRYDHGHTPDLPGRDRFTGPVVHPQDWPPDLEVAGRHVVVIGSGATAATLVPALADLGARVTMVQRSPTYYLTVATRDALANLARRFVSPGRAYAWTRRKNVRSQSVFYRLSRRYPNAVKRLLVRNVAKQLPPGYDVERHFTPRYDPWDQRICLTPDGDLFAAISAGTVEVVTDTLETFTERGLRTTSGVELEADVVVTATGLDLLAFGGIEIVVDGVRMDPGERLVYKSVMVSDVPNFAFVFGYTNASWTLKVDLVCEWLCRCLAHLEHSGATTAVAVNDDPTMVTGPMLEFGAGYVQRSLPDFPRQGTGVWSVAMRYADDERRLRREPLVDGVLRFSGSRAGSRGGVDRDAESGAGSGPGSDADVASGTGTGRSAP